MSAQTHKPATVGPPVISSPLDDTVYRALTLSNELRVLIASDPTSEKAAAAMNVGVGNYSDPENLPGLAHFTEHMVFLGTTKYPEEGSFNSFLAENGGFTNAYTASEDTNFHFEMVESDRASNTDAPRFREALDRFAQFFTAPLFTETATERELNAVHSEHQKNLQSDGRRLNQLKRSVAVNPAHPASKFSTGNKETLFDIPQKQGTDTRTALLNFHREFYSANLMSLCIVAPHELDVLQEWVETLFSAIPNHSCLDPSNVYAQVPLLLDEHRGLVFHVQPVRDIRGIDITWYTPSYRQYDKEKPAYFVTEFLGDEAEGSLLSLLKKRGWCDSLVVSHYDNATYGCFDMSCTLTVEGVEHVDEILALIYKYVGLLRESGVTQQRYEKNMTLSANNFRFRERDEPTNFVTRVSSSMMHHSQEDYIAGMFLYRKFDAKLVHDALRHITPDNSTTVISGKFVKDDLATKRERWYDSAYHVERASPERIAKWTDPTPEPGLYLPDVNPFIPTELDVIGTPLKEGEMDLEGPRLVANNEYFELHHKLDRTFNRPQAYIRMTMYSAHAYLSPEHSVLGALFSALLDDVLMEFSYPAQKAGFQYHLYHNHKGFHLNVSGYSHRIDVLMFAILEKMRSFKTDVTRFEMQYDLIERHYRNFDKAQPVSRAMYNVQHLMRERMWHVQEYIEVFESGKLTVERVEQFAVDVLREMRVVGMVVGNVTEERAVSMMQTVQSTLGYAPLRSSQRTCMRVVRLPNDREVFRREENPNADDGNSAIEVFYQMGPRGNLREDVKLELLAEILEKPTFHELRTVQQLGYMVFTGVNDLDGVRGLLVAVQSTVVDPDELLERIDKLVKSVREDTFATMSDEKMGDYIKAMRSNKAEPDRSLERRSRRFWQEIDNEWFVFDRAQREIEHVDAVSKKDILEFFDALVVPGGTRRRRVVSQVYCKAHSFDKRCERSGKQLDVKDVVAFRRASELYPVTSGGVP